MNEAGCIEGAVASVGPDAEVIVSDGGSADNTPAVAARLGARVMGCPPGRGAQMDAGAARARGEVFLFLHADTRLPENWDRAVRDALMDDRAVAGAFRLRIDSKEKRFRLIERAAALRCRALGLIYGDQAIFVRKESFLRAGGYMSLPLMEDIDCVKRLRRLGRVVLLKEGVHTSPRRWAGSGVIRNTLRNALVLSLYFLGASPLRLYSLYYGDRMKMKILRHK